MRDIRKTWGSKQKSRTLVQGVMSGADLQGSKRNDVWLNEVA